MAKKTRREIKEAFKTGAQPTGADFQNFVESVINSKDDGIEKQGQNLPLKIKAQGSGKNVLDIYDDSTHTWRVNQKPGGKSGLNIEDSSSKTRLFVQEGDGNVGISTTSPRAKLHVTQAANQGDALRVDDESGDATPFVITGGGTVGVGTGSPSAANALHVAGKVKVDESIQLKTGVTVNEFSSDSNLGGDSAESDDAVPTEKAVKTYVNTKNKEAMDELVKVQNDINAELANKVGPGGDANVDFAAKKLTAGTIQLKAGVEIEEFSNDAKLENKSSKAVPTEKAVKTYVDARAPSRIKWGSVQMTGWVNGWDGVLNYTVPDQSVMVGLYSEHSNSKEDRRFKVRYRSLELVIGS